MRIFLRAFVAVHILYASVGITRSNQSFVLLTAVGHLPNTDVAGVYGKIKTDLLLNLSAHNRRLFCEKCGVRCRITEARDSTSVVSPRFQKIAAILTALRELPPSDLLLYLDNDVFISNSSCDVLISLAIAFDSDPSAALALSFDHKQRGPVSSRSFQTGVMVVKPTAATQEFFARVWAMRFQRFSDQKAINQELRRLKRVNTVMVLPRIVFNSFPKYSTKIWSLLGLPQGDEVQNRSVFVHFAGQFGGANIETGHSDSLILLLVAQEALHRHQRFLESYRSYLWSSPSTAKDLAVQTPAVRMTRLERELAEVKSLAKSMSLCIDRVFRRFDVVEAGRDAQECFQLFQSYTASLQF